MSELIIYYNFSEKASGSDNSMILLIETLLNRGGYLLHLITSSNNKKTQHLESRGAQLFYLQKKFPEESQLNKTLNLVITSFRIWRLIRSNKTLRKSELLIVRSLLSVFVIAPTCFLLKKKYIWDIGFEKNFFLSGAFRTFFLKNAQSVVLQYPAQKQDVFNSGAIKKYSEKLKVIIPGLSGEDKMERARQTNRISSDAECLTISCAAFIHPRKNQLEALRILNLLLDSGKNYKFIFIGEIKSIPYHTKMLEYIAEHQLDDYVSFLGWRNDVIELMCESHIVIIPSLIEGLPHALREAMYTGNVVVARYSGGMKDFITSHKNGLIYKGENDLQKAADFIESLNHNRKRLEEMGKKNREVANEILDREKWKADYLKLIDQSL